MKQSKLISSLCIVLLIAQLSIILSLRTSIGNSTSYDLLIIAHEDFIETLR